MIHLGYYGFAIGAIHLNISSLNNEQTHIAGKTYARMFNCMTAVYLFCLPFIVLVFITIISQAPELADELLIGIIFALLGLWGVQVRLRAINETILNGLKYTLRQ